MVKQKIKPTSIRIPENLLEGIDQKCEGLGCSRNDYITSVLDEAVHNEISEIEDREQSKVLDNSNKPPKEVYID